MNKQLLLALALWGVAALAYAQPRAGLQQISASFGAGRVSDGQTSSFGSSSENDRPTVNVGFSYSRFRSERWAWSMGASFSGTTFSFDLSANSPSGLPVEERFRSYYLNGGITRFYKLNEKWFASVGGGLSFGYNRTRRVQSDRTSNNLILEEDTDGYSVGLSAGAGLSYFFHPRWAASVGMSLVGANYTWSTGEARGGSTLQAFRQSSRSSWNASFLPSASVGSWFISVSYQF